MGTRPSLGQGAWGQRVQATAPAACHLGSHRVATFLAIALDHPTINHHQSHPLATHIPSSLLSLAAPNGLVLTRWPCVLTLLPPPFPYVVHRPRPPPTSAPPHLRTSAQSTAADTSAVVQPTPSGMFPPNFSHAAGVQLCIPTPPARLRLVGCSRTIVADIYSGRDAFAVCPVREPHLFGHGPSRWASTDCELVLTGEADASLRRCTLSQSRSSRLRCGIPSPTVRIALARACRSCDVVADLR